ncbi:MAG: class I SAM-dependent methyltransferase [Bellilinea sp.]
MTDPAAVQSLVEAVRNAPKYTAMDAGLVQALVEQELGKGRGVKETIKAVRNKLHQVGSAYQEKPIGYAQLSRRLAALPRDLHSPEIKPFCLEAMREHTSTRERLGFLEEFYSQTLASLGPIHSLIDLACGLNPLALPWLPLAPNAQLFACDIYTDMTGFLNAFYAHTGVNGRAFTCDLIHNLPDIPVKPVQLALLLKTIPCLEQVDKSIGRRLLSSIQAENMLVSFPVHSLGGRGKGMRTNYDQHFQELVSGLPWQVTRFDFPGELVYTLSRM